MPTPSTLGYTPGRIIDTLRNVGKDPRPILVGIGVYLTARAQEAFVQQRRGNVRWKPRRVPNVAGIVADLRVGRDPPKRRLDPTPALVDTGRLKSELKSRVTGKNVVEIGTNLPHASKLQFGGKSTQPVPPSVKDALRRLLKKSPWREFDLELEWLLDPDVTTLTTDVPARPFVMWTRDDGKAVNKMVLAAFTGKPLKQLLIGKAA